jgi:hypothetical protein
MSPGEGHDVGLWQFLRAECLLYGASGLLPRALLVPEFTPVNESVQPHDGKNAVAQVFVCLNVGPTLSHARSSCPLNPNLREYAQEGASDEDLYRLY